MLATWISDPACQYTPWSAARARELATTLQIARCHGLFRPFLRGFVKVGFRLHFTLFVMENQEDLCDEDCDLVIRDIGNSLGATDLQRSIAGNEVIILFHPNHKRAAETRRHHQVVLVNKTDCPAVGSLQTGKSHLNCS